MKLPLVLAIAQIALGLTIAVVCLFTQTEKCPTEFTFSYNGSNVTVNINPGPEQIRDHSLTRAASVFGFIVFCIGITQLVYVRRSSKGTSYPDKALNVT